MIIGLGHRARSGKDTVASYLVNNHNFIQESFAFPLKEFIGRHILGFNDKELYGNWKEVINPEWGMTPRKMLQLIGSDALRGVVHNDFWVIPMKKKLNEHIRNGHNVVVSDLRFKNETALIKNLNGWLINIERDNLDKINGIEKHISEVELEDFNGWNYTLDNNDTLEKLYEGVETILRNINE